MDDDIAYSEDEYFSDEMDDMECGADPTVMEPQVSSTTREAGDGDFPHKVLTTEDIHKHMRETIGEVKSIVELPDTIIRILLNHFKWDKEKLVETFFEGSQERLFKEAHICYPLVTAQKCHQSNQISSTSGASSSRVTRRHSSKAPRDCEICLVPYPNNEMTGLLCGHIFCPNCWNEYLCTKVMHQGMGQTISCAAHGCDIIVDDRTVMRLVRDERVRRKYLHLTTNSFVECNKLIRWCPSPDCGHAVKAQSFDVKPVTCSCGHRFCFGCGEFWHDPVRCYWLRKWMKKCDDDSETSNWIAANTKECPKCHVTIEKDGGCNHMVCRSSACRADFCWVCLGPWEPHGSSWYNCNRFDEDAAVRARTAQEISRAALQRYLHYCNRYMNHSQSLKFENKLYAKVKNKMEEMQKHNMSWIEVQFLKKAVDVLCLCRQTLMFTYVFAFYLKKNNQSMIFEDNQSDLEQATEQLSEYLERDITSDNLVIIKQNVQDKFRYCQGRQGVLLDHVHEGYDKDWWEYQPGL